MALDEQNDMEGPVLRLRRARRLHNASELELAIFRICDRFSIAR